MSTPKRHGPKCADFIIGRLRICNIRIAQLEAELAEMQSTMSSITDWCDAYPLDEFPELDMQEVRGKLGDSLLSRLSAYNMRHVLKGIKEIASRLPKVAQAPARTADLLQSSSGVWASPSDKQHDEDVLEAYHRGWEDARAESAN